MQAAHLQELIDLEESYWWHVAKRQLALELLQQFCPPPGKLVEGGVGSARNLLAFRDLGYDVAGYDVMPESVEFSRSRGLDVRQHDLGLPWPASEGSLRAVVLLDVIEHVPDPVLVLSHAHRALAPGGCAIITVPAYQWLFSDWDQALGHYRRYSMQMLRNQAQAAGFSIARLTHWNAFTLPAAMAIRGCEKLLPRGRAAEFPRVSPLTNRMLLNCAAAERWMMSRLPVPCGLSVVGVLRK